jgi:hypothetical protein
MRTACRRRWIAAGVALASLAVGVAPVAASEKRDSSTESGQLVDFSLLLTSASPSSPTGLALHAAALGEGKPSPLRSAVYQLPAGTRFDTGTLTECNASDVEFQLLGTNACPSDSLLTVGSFSAISGFGPPLDPFIGDVHVFDGSSQLIEVITFKDSSISPAIDRLTISDSTLTAHPPRAPGGPPDGEMAVKSIDYEIPPLSRGTRSLITTPPRCPAGGRWTSTGTFGFADGSVETDVSTMRCKRSR